MQCQSFNLKTKPEMAKNLTLILELKSQDRHICINKLCYFIYKCDILKVLKPPQKNLSFEIIIISILICQKMHMF